jgi:methionyl-tRNA synthetase
MKEQKARYITTTLPYVNADPHIGFAYELLVGDALARFWRLMGYEVFFNTGTDEHGQKIAEKADKEGIDRKVYVDEYAGTFAQLKDGLRLSYDAFIRTSNESHKRAAQEMWRRCASNVNEKGESDIYKKKYKGLYCVGDEMFLRESDLVDGRCPNHPNVDPVEIEEENYFFRLSRYQKQLQVYLADPTRTLSESYRKWALEFVGGGLEDLSISRSKARLDWGIPVPDDDEQVMYVWFDALTNYISTLGWPEDIDDNFKKFWEDGETVQLAGKDQVRFQSVIWQAMLLSANVPHTDVINYHGFINSGGQKMSKSLGNVISPYELVEKYGTDATRYLLLRHVHPSEDTDITSERLDEWYTANLVNGLGNLVARIMQMAETHLDAPIIRPEPTGFPKEYTDALDAYNVQSTCDYIWQKVGELDEKIAQTEPFKLVKTDRPAAQKIIIELVTELYTIGRLLYPIMPATNVIIKEAILINKKPENLFGRLEK